MTYNKPEFFCSPEMLEKFDKSYKINYKKENELEVLTVKNGIIHPLELSETMQNGNKQFGGVTDENLKFIDFSLQKRYKEDSKTNEDDWYIGANPNLNPKTIKYIDEEIVFLGPIKKHFAHFYLETLSRIWFFLDQNHLNYKIAYLTQDGDKPKYELMNEFFNLLGLQMENFIEIKEPTKFKNVIIPEQSYELQHNYHPLYKQTIDRLKLTITPGIHKKVYFSKKFNYPGSPRTIGDYISEELFKKNGYSIFYPDKMNLTETLSILKGCEEFVASSSSNAYNAIFLNDETKVIVLNRSEHVHPTQTMIDKMKNLKSIYIDSFYGLLPVDWSIGPFTFCYTKYLENFLKKYQMNFNKKKLFEKYTQNLLLFIKSWAEFYSNPLWLECLPSKTIKTEDLVKNIQKLDLKYNRLTILDKCKKNFNKLLFITYNIFDYRRENV